MKQLKRFAAALCACALLISPSLARADLFAAGFAQYRKILTSSAPTACTNLAAGFFPLIVLQNVGSATTVFPTVYDESTPTCSDADRVFGNGTSITLGAGQVVVLYAGTSRGVTYKLSGALTDNLVIGW